MLRQVIFVLLASMLVPFPIKAQDKEGKGKFEVGVQFSVLRQGDGVFIFGPTSAEFGDLRLDRTALGGGGRVVYNLLRKDQAWISALCQDLGRLYSRECRAPVRF